MKLPELFATTELGNKAFHNALLKIRLHYVEDFYFEQEQVNLHWYKMKSSE
ncbi:hypothetical protein [Formosa maritima]|uniref:hypothetical protein n=1 Tax=Formosa maritima TaxID=2592046 RepID=UPI001315875C|nr:hypothetical protein [Formosa maritima]